MIVSSTCDRKEGIQSQEEKGGNGWVMSQYIDVSTLTNGGRWIDGIRDEEKERTAPQPTP
jgi:hypothetical protein